jgi:serine/threonine-protein kinase
VLQVCPKCREEYPEDTEFCPECHQPLCDREDLQRVGVEYGNYKITGIIGVGGMGVVYKATHTVLLKPVAIKILNERYLHRKEAAREMLREAQAASRIRHPHIVDVTDFGTTPDGAPYFVMEFLEGESLNELLNHVGRLPVGRAARILLQVAGALEAAHKQGIIHRDLKPENIFLVDLTKADRTQPGDFVKLLDFGLAKVLDMGPSSRTRAGMLAGTPWYMSPEQVQNRQVSVRSDVYSLGIVFYQMVTGTVPFTGESTVDILMGHVSSAVIQPYKYNKLIDEDTNRVIMRCLEKHPDDRFQSMDELCEALELCGTNLKLESGDILPEVAAGGPNAVALGAPTITSELAGQVLGRGSGAEQHASSELRIASSRTSQPTEDSGLVRELLAGSDAARADGSDFEVRPGAEVIDDALSTGSAVHRLSVPPPTGKRLLDPGRRRRWLLPVLVICVIVVSGAAAFVAHFTARPEPPAPPTPTLSPEPKTVRVDLNGLPAGARVYLDGRAVAVPIIVTGSDEPHALAVEADGYRTHRQQLILNENHRIQLQLEPEPGSRPAPAAKVAAKSRRRPRHPRRRPRRRVKPKPAAKVPEKPPQPKKKPGKPKAAPKTKKYKDWVMDPEI